MRIHYYCLLILLLSCNSEELSEKATLLKDNSISIRNLSNLNNSIYEEIKNYDVIMVGEMHGTNEPAVLAAGLCKLITKHEGSVVLGLEIPPSQLNGFTADMSIDQIVQLGYFQGENSSGMNGESWLHLINESNQNENIITKFIDTQIYERDTSMYLSVLDIKKANPNTKIVTLTGNIHNMLKPYNDQLKLGGYLMKDTINFNPERLMSICHIFNKGTMLNNIGNGLELTTLEGKENVFNKTVSSEMFLTKSIYEDYDAYTHILYTEEVTHSKVIDFNDYKKLLQ